MDKPEPILTSLQAFFEARTVLTACDLDLFSALHDKPSSAKQIADSQGLDLRVLTRILDFLASFDYLTKEGSGYQTTEKGALLSAHHLLTVLPMALHYSFVWNRWSRLTAIAKDGPPQEGIPVLERDPTIQEAFIGAMHVIGRRLSEQIAQEFDSSRVSRLLDVGGASGTYTIAFLKKNPRLRAVIFDLEPVIDLAKKHVAGESLTNRVEFVPGDFYKDDLPKPCDLALLSAIIHQNSPKQNIALFTKVVHALDPGGTILIRDYVMNESRTMPPQGTLFAINMLVNTPGGDTYTFGEIQEQLEHVGFKNITLVREDDHMGSLVEGRK